MANTPETGFVRRVMKLIETYLADQVALLQLQAAEKSAIIAGKLVAFLLLFSLAMAALFFASIATGFVIYHYTHSLWQSFAWVSLFYTMLFLMVLLRMKPLAKRVANQVIHFLFQNDSMH